MNMHQIHVDSPQWWSFVTVAALQRRRTVEKSGRAGLSVERTDGCSAGT